VLRSKFLCMSSNSTPPEVHGPLGYEAVPIFKDTCGVFLRSNHLGHVLLTTHATIST